ncbi:hypothetical protein [Streptomyces sp. NPDC017529]|uniref:hypothetical protein n=1 Tax=Streptomyces sp. NPDC017529 TaxID=3365000 RepID=UPI0037B56FB8
MHTCPHGPALRNAEDELARLRTALGLAAAFIHNPAYPLDARTALAMALGLPEPTQ